MTFHVIRASTFLDDEKDIVLNTIEELMDFVRCEGNVIVTNGWGGTTGPTIVIYDDYLE